MNLSDYMDEELMNLDISSSKKEDIIRELISPVIEKGVATSRNTLVRAIMNRESLGSTAIGNGIAIPHAKSSCIKRKAIVFGRSKKGVNFDSIDGKPVNIFFLIVSPEGEAGPHLKMLARISRLLKDEDFRDSLMLLPTEYQIIEYIRSREVEK